MPSVARTRYGTAFQFTFITADPDLAEAADTAGIDRVGIDIERVGKADRQGHLPHLRISTHDIPDLPAVRARLRRAQAFLRCNPVHAGSRDEINQALDAGAQVLMLPYFHRSLEVERFISLVGGRAEVSLLVETRAAIRSLDAILRLPGISEVMIGLNDLQHDIGLPNPFLLVTSGMLESVAERVCAAGLRFGFGGLADPAHLALPIPSTLVAAQYPRLGATSAFVARQFTPERLSAQALADGLARCRATLQEWSDRPATDRAAARQALAHLARVWSPSSPEGKRALDESGKDDWERMLFNDLRSDRR